MFTELYLPSGSMLFLGLGITHLHSFLCWKDLCFAGQVSFTVWRKITSFFCSNYSDQM